MSYISMQFNSQITVIILNGFRIKSGMTMVIDRSFQERLQNLISEFKTIPAQNQYFKVEEHQTAHYIR